LAASGWITGHENAQALQASQQALASDEDWVKFVDKGVAGVYADDPSATTADLPPGVRAERTRESSPALRPAGGYVSRATSCS
jgi:hypothetical protein